MAKVTIKNEKSFEEAKNKAVGVICYRKLEDGQIVAVKCPTHRKKK